MHSEYISQASFFIPSVKGLGEIFYNSELKEPNCNL